MKANKKVLTILVVVAVVALAVLGGLYAYKGEELMGFMRGQSKSKVAKLPWYCEPVGSDRGSSNSGSTQNTSSSSRRFISPDAFKAIHDLGPSGSSFWKYGPFFGGSVVPGGNSGGSAGSVEIPEFNVTPDEDTGDKQVNVSCLCPAAQWNDGRITIGLDEDYYYSEFGGDNEKVCEVYAPDEDCANPMTVTCTCNKQKITDTISQWQYENIYDSSSSEYCEMHFTDFECNPRWWCPDGSSTNYDKIFDVCPSLWDAKRTTCIAENCPDLGVTAPAPADPKAEEFCKAFWGSAWLEGACDDVSALSCPSMADCVKYQDWANAGVSTYEMAELLEGEGKSQEEIDDMFNVCGWLF